ncbi:DsrE/DsrF/DrsH-like family protein [Paenibacillus albicereus]|uniref:DsrE/DsrF/DrsH-like family protein n=1 Tax=Paenibacillus albicereus TaxID=2726185 RepID=UPI001F43E7DB|nr:DsrE/DsrF/DrsH-like family protein [Paenibacillus albicereus]
MTRKILIVGGVAGGASAAARLRRLDENAQIVLFERDDHISFANCGLPYYIGGSIQDRSRLLVQTPEAMTARYRLDIRVRSEVVAVDAAARNVTVRTRDGRTYEETYDALLLSPGAKPIVPPVPGAGLDAVTTLRNLADTDRIKSLVDRQGTRSALVVGGGFIGVEMAENLREAGLDVTLVQSSGQILAPFDPELASMLQTELERAGVRVLLHETAKAFRELAGGAVETELAGGGFIRSELVVLAVGVEPDTAFLHGSGIPLGERGHILVDESMRAGADGVYAVGDAVLVRELQSGRPSAVPLAGPANKQGRIAADAICGLPSTYKGAQGTSIIKVFGLTGAATGRSEKTLREQGVPYEATYVHPASHAGYYPNAAPMALKLLFAPDGAVLGAQAVGADGVDKRIDSIAAVLRLGGTVHDLAELELAYAPPYSSAKDPVNMAGYTAENILAGRMPVFHAPELAERDESATLLVDVRSVMEHEAGHIPGSLLVPVDELRERLAELDPSREIWVYCQVGMRGYTASRILAQQGYRVRNLSGGFKTYRLFEAAKRMDEKASQARLQAPSAVPIAATSEAPDRPDAAGGAAAASQPQGGSGAAPAAVPARDGSGAIGTAVQEPLGGSRADGRHAVRQDGLPSSDARETASVSSAARAAVETVARPLASFAPAAAAPAAVGDAPARAGLPQPDATLDACGLSCPGPLIEVKRRMDSLEPGQVLRVQATDPGFGEDVGAWARMYGAELLQAGRAEGGRFEALLRKRPAAALAASGAPASTAPAAAPAAPEGSTLVVFSGDLDKAIASFIIANGAASSGKKVTLFFTFWGLNVIRKPERVQADKGLVGKMFGLMMPRGSTRLGMSRMNMGGLGAKMIRGVMKGSGISSLEELIQTALDQGVEIVACSMSMDVMGLKREELIDGVKVGGVGYYLGKADQSGINLFI